MTNQEAEKLKPGEKVRLRGSSKLLEVSSVTGYYRKSPGSKYRELRVVVVDDRGEYQEINGTQIQRIV